MLLHPYMPASTARLLDALGAPAIEYSGASFADRGSGATAKALEPLFPKRA